MFLKLAELENAATMHMAESVGLDFRSLLESETVPVKKISKYTKGQVGADKRTTPERKPPTDVHAVDFAPTVVAAAVPDTGAARPELTRSSTEPAMYLGSASDNPTKPEREPPADAHAKPKLRVGAIPWIFENLPAYLTKPKPWSRSQRENPPAKLRRVSSPINDGTAASVSSSTEPCDPEAARDDGAVISNGSCTEMACQTQGNVCSISELHAVKDKLRSMKQQLRLCQEWIYESLRRKIKSTAVYTFLHESEFRPLPNPRTLYGHLRNLKADSGFDSTLFTVLCEKLEAVPKRERRGVLMFDEMSVRKSFHIRESNMALLGKVDFAEHTRPGDHGKDRLIVAKLLLQCIVHLTNAGVVADAVTCDNSTSSKSALRYLGVNRDMHKLQTCFEHPCEPSKQVHVVIDTPHIFRCIRINLLKVGKFLLPQGQEVFHCHYKD
ncbi:hypothetical protein MRX96_009851 [Rhipicephalus microplus]